MKGTKTIQGFSGMDLDSHSDAIDTRHGRYRRGVNVRIYPKGIISTIMGTKEVLWTPPAGQNYPIGEMWDSESDSTFIFFWNSNNADSIVRLYADTLAVQVIIQADLGFSRTSVISGCDLVFQELLQWTDSAHNDPRQVDVVRANDTDKNYKLRVFFPVSPNNVDSRVFGASILNPTGTTVTANSAFHVSSSTEVYGFTTMARAWADSFNATFGTYFTATSCGSFVEVEAVATGAWSIAIRYTDTINGIAQPQAVQLWEYRNTYLKPITRFQIDRAKFAPMNPPEVSVFNDPVRSDNRIERHVFQFSLRYVFRNGERSVEGPWTEIAAVSPSTYGASTAGNSILVDFSNDPNLIQRSALEEVDQIEMFVKDGEGLWKSAVLLEKWEFIYGLTWTFRNDLQMSAYQGSSGGINEPFPLNLQTYVPQRAFAQALVSDPNNQENMRGMLGGCIEGLPTPCIPADIGITYNDTSIINGQTCSIRLLIRIENPNALLVTRQVIHRIDNASAFVFGGMKVAIPSIFNDYVDPSQLKQVIPAGGFTAYLAGTQHYGISRQVIGPNSFPLSYVAGTTVLDTSTVAKRVAVYGLLYDSAVDIYQEVIITGVRPGQSYVLRLAEHRCAILNDSANIYDLAGTTLGWQRTSTQTIAVGLNGQSGTTPGYFEARLDIPANFTGVWEAGNACVLDCAYPSPNLFDEFSVIRTYFFDANGVNYSPSFDIRNTGVSAERQLFQLDHGVVLPSGAALVAQGYGILQYMTGGLSLSDHNGHAFIPVLRNLGNEECRWRTNAGNPATPTALTDANSYASDKWRGNMQTANPLTGPDNGPLFFSQNIAEYIVPNLVGDRDFMRTLVDGVVEDQNGTPLSGIMIVVESGHVSASGTGGVFSIPMYADCADGGVVGLTMNRRVNDGLVFSSVGFVSVTFPALGYIGPLNIYKFETPYQYSEQIHFGPVTQVGNIPVNATVGGVWPRGWRGAFGIILYDQHGRVTPVQKLIDAYIPWQTEDLNRINPGLYPPGTFITGLPDIAFTVNGPVPVPDYGRFVRYQFVATKNTLHSYMLQWAVPSVAYITSWNEDTSTPVLTTAGTGNATEILVYFTDSFTQFRALNADAAGLDSAGKFVQFGQVGYEYTDGDRLIFLTDSTGATIPFLDVSIIAQRGNAVVIKADSTIPPLNGGENVVIYRPGLVDTSDGGRPYFEIPEASYAIIDPFGTPSWGTATGILPGGDSYVIGTQIPVRPGFVQGTTTTPWSVINVNRQSTAISDFYPSSVPSLGRTHSEDPLAKTELITTRVRFSDPWVKGSSYNGLCTFNALDFRDANPRHGTIRSMMSISDVVVCLCEASLSFSIYIGTVTSRAADGVLSAATNQFIGQVRDFALEFGTMNPESVHRYKTWIFFFDYNQGALVRYSVNGFDAVDFQCGKHIQDLTRLYDGTPLPRIITGVNTAFDEVWLSFEPRTRTIPGTGIDYEIGNETLVFNDSGKAWVSAPRALPSMYSRMRTAMLGIFNGRIFIHDATDVAANFYGTQHPWGLEYVVNENPAVLKVWQASMVTGSPGFQFSFVADNGQQSTSGAKRISDADHAARGILPDGNGNKLRSRTMTVTVLNLGTGEGTIQSCDTRWTAVDPKP